MRRLAALPFALLVATPSLAVEPLMPPHIVAEEFCLARLIGDMTMISDYLTSELYSAVGHAIVKNDEIQKQYPDEKPPLGDGVPWASYQDAPAECLVDYEAAKTHPTEVPITYKFADAPDATFTDTLILKQVDDEWQLDDVAYNDGSRLTAVLIAAFEP
jgi:hypothetical protein